MFMKLFSSETSNDNVVMTPPLKSGNEEIPGKKTLFILFWSFFQGLNVALWSESHN